MVVGESANCRAMADAAREQGINTTVVGEIDEAITVVDAILRRAPQGAVDWAARTAKDVVLAKASNAQALWRVADGLLA